MNDITSLLLADTVARLATCEEVLARIHSDDQNFIVCDAKNNNHHVTFDRETCIAHMSCSRVPRAYTEVEALSLSATFRHTRPGRLFAIVVMSELEWWTAEKERMERIRADIEESVARLVAATTVV